MKDASHISNTINRGSLVVQILSGLVLGYFTVYFISASEVSIDISAAKQVAGSLGGVLVVLLVEKISGLADKHISWQSHTGGRLLLQLIFVAGVILAGVYLFLTFSLTGTEKSISREFPVKVTVFSVVVSLTYSVLYFVRYSYNHYAYTQVQLVKQERKQIKLQLNALRSQLSPHFLFNSLNAISSLVYTPGADTERFIRQLAYVYKYVLESYRQTLVTLAEEAAFAQAYFHLLTVRFGDQLSVSYHFTEESLSSQIPPVTLQLLIENAVKHNPPTQEQPLKINISTDKTHMRVSNNLLPNANPPASHKVGLNNIKARYKLLSGKEIKVISNKDIFTVMLPLIP